jgi:hypothetical protein
MAFLDLGYALTRILSFGFPKNTNKGQFVIHMPVTYRFHRTRHYAQRVAHRELSEETVKQVVYYGKKTALPNRPLHKGRVFMFEKKVDGITFRVVAEIKDSECWLMTSYEK